MPLRKPNTGKKSATGTVNFSAATGNPIIVTGLDFKASMVVWEVYSSAANAYYHGFYAAQSNSLNYITDVTTTSTNNSDYNPKTGATITATGFSIPTLYGGAPLPVKWWAFE